MNIATVLAFAKQLERSQRRGSDYDELYFGLQDLIMMLEEARYDNDLALERSSRLREFGGRKTYDRSLQALKKANKPKRKLSKWQKFVKANSKKKAYIYQSGAKKGKLNLKKMGIAYRRQKK